MLLRDCAVCHAIDFHTRKKLSAEKGQEAPWASPQGLVRAGSAGSTASSGLNMAAAALRAVRRALCLGGWVQFFSEPIDVLALVAVRATLAYLAAGRNGQRGASFACAYRA